VHAARDVGEAGGEVAGRAVAQRGAVQELIALTAEQRAEGVVDVDDPAPIGAVDADDRLTDRRVGERARNRWSAARAARSWCRRSVTSSTCAMTVSGGA
jgi:hypothetical protein